MSSWNPSKGGPEPSRRRSQRVILTLAVKVRTEDGRRDGSFEENTQTLLVNAHGALIALAHKVEKGQKLLITNTATKVEHRCQVAHLGPSSGGKYQVGIEFTSPSPDFWRIAFPPEDWVVPEPEQVPARCK
jgi:PilZ domain